jgi:hypothetical protein
MLSKHGFYVGRHQHHFDRSLAAALCRFFAGISVIDFGCGDGAYVRALRDAGIDARGYDGNPLADSIPNCRTLDLAVAVEVKSEPWVLSLEVGEHIPREFEATFIDNVCRHGLIGTVISWAILGQAGIGHVNCRDNDYIEQLFAHRGFTRQRDLETSLRQATSLPWFRNTLMVYVRAVQQPSSLYGSDGKGSRTRQP